MNIHEAETRDGHISEYSQVLFDALPNKNNYTVNCIPKQTTGVSFYWFICSAVPPLSEIGEFSAFVIYDVTISANELGASNSYLIKFGDLFFTTVELVHFMATFFAFFIDRYAGTCIFSP